jgi:hypothetical protein
MACNVMSMILTKHVTDMTVKHIRVNTNVGTTKHC